MSDELRDEGPTHPFMKHRGFEEYPFPFSTGEIGLLALPNPLPYEDAIRLADFVLALSGFEDQEAS